MTKRKTQLAPPNHTHALPGPDDITRVVLPNGVTVLARENFTSPSVVIDGIVRSGGLHEPDDKAGLASFHSDMLMRGTEHHAFEALFEEIESIGASVDFNTGGHTLGFGSKSLAEDLPLMLQLISEVLREPTFPPDHMEKVRGEIMTGLHMRAHDTRRTANLAFHELAYPGHPYRRSLHGYLETVPPITRDDIVGFHHGIGPQGAVLVIVGAVKAADAVKMAEDVLGGWTNPAQRSAPVAPDAAPIGEIRRKDTIISGKTQSDIVLGNPGPPRVAPDYQAARMANSILGVFGLYGRLGDEVREKQGLAYYSFSRLDGGFGPGPWMVSAGVDPAKVERALDTIRGEIRKIVSLPVTAEELSDNKSFFKGQLVIGLETNEGVAGSIMTMEKHALGLDHLRNYGRMVDAITVEAVQAAAAHYLNPDGFAVAVAGPGNKSG